jgi:hypothetical protein
MPELIDDESRPVTLYVERVEPNPDINYFIEKRRVSVIDIEITKTHAAQIIEYLQQRSQGQSGAIRLRLLGRLTHQ